MKILYWGSLAISTGGPAHSLYMSATGSIACGDQCEIVMTPLVPGDTLRSEEIPVHYTSAPMLSRWQWIPRLAPRLVTLGEFDIYHIQGIWSLAAHQVCSFARAQNKPYLVSLRGMLYPQAIAGKSRFIKKTALRLYLARDLEMAACIHATCQEEASHYRAMGFTNAVAILPNPVELGAITPLIPKTLKTFRIGFLGRLHPRKHVERLIYALADTRLQNMPVELVIIGADDAKYEAFLRAEVKRLHLTNVSFCGFLKGQQKAQVLSSLSVLAVPSDFENFGNIVTEALANSIPVIASRGMPWQDLETYDAGWWISNDQETLTTTLLTAALLSPEALRQKGAHGRKLLELYYDQTVIAPKLHNLYQWIARKAPCPDFVELK